MRLFGWFRKPIEPTPTPMREVKVVDKYDIGQIDVYTPEGVFPEKFEIGDRFNGYDFSEGFLRIHAINGELVCYKQEDVQRFIVKEISKATYKKVLRSA